MSLHEDMAALSAVLAEAAVQADAGALVDLTGLESRVALLCAAVEALPRGEGRGLLFGLESMLDALDALAGTLSRQRDLAAGTETYTARQRAAAVYGRPASVPDET